MAPAEALKDEDQSLHLETVEPDLKTNNYGREQPHVSTAKVLATNPRIIALSIFANVGALMYGFDTMSLSLCLSMTAFE